MNLLRLRHTVFLQKPLQVPALQSLRQLPQPGYRRQLRLQLGLKEIFILPQPPGRGGKGQADAGVLRPEQGHHRMPDAVAQEFVCRVGAVLPVGQVVFLQKGLHLLPGDIQHGADDGPIHRGDAPQSLQPGAPEQVHEHGFGVVIGGVGSGDFSREGAQKRVSCLPGGGLQPLLPGTHLSAPNGEGNAVAGAEIPNEGLVGVGLRPPEMVVKMGGGQVYLQFFPQQVHSKQQRHGIRPAGDGADHRFPRRCQLPEGGRELIQHASTPGR